MSDDGDSGRGSPVCDEDGYEIIHSVETLNIIKEADRVLHILQDTYDPSTLKLALIELKTLFKYPMVRKYLEDNQIHLGVLSVMRHLGSFSEIQQIGLQLLCQFIDESLQLEKSLKNEHIHRHVLKVMRENLSDVPIHRCGMKLLSCLFESRYIRVDLTSANLLKEVVDYLFQAVSNFQDDAEIQLYALTCLRDILLEDENSVEIFLSSYLPVVLQTLHLNRTEHEVVAIILEVFYILNQKYHVTKIFEQKDIHKEIMPYVKIETGNEEVVIASLQLLNLLFEDPKVVTSAVETGFLMSSLLPVMLGKQFCETIQVCGLHIFCLSAKRLFEEKGTIEMASQWLKVIYTAMSVLMDRPDVQEAGCLAVCELLECKSEAYMWIGESSELKQDPLHTLCLGAALMGRKELAVFTASCNAIYHLTADNDGLCKCLMEKNAHIAVLEGMSVHISDAPAMAAACRSLRGLSIFHDEHKEAITLHDHTLMYLSIILKTFPDNLEVQREAISTIACLADIDVFRHLCFLKKIHKKILAAMLEFAESDILIEAAIEALAVLGGAASGGEILNSLHVVEKVIQCLKMYPYNENIQKKGLILIQILADSSLISTTAMCRTLSEVIIRVMRMHADNLSIQRETVVAMQILAEKGQRMSEVLVSEGCHKVLFGLLDNFDVDQGLHDLASECLYVIGCVQNLKSKMLLSACRNGFLAGVECLMEIGADVNVGDGYETPLYCAVQNQDENMVQFLLQQAVTDTQTSLQLSLKRRLYNITGMLLAHISQDRDSGTVLWNAYGLGDLQPEWFIPSLAHKQRRKTQTSVAGKHLLEKIKRSEQRRKTRLRYSPSDSQLEIDRHHYFRYRRNSTENSLKTSGESKTEVSGISGHIKSKRHKSLPKDIFRNDPRRARSQGEKLSPTKQSPPESSPLSTSTRKVHATGFKSTTLPNKLESSNKPELDILETPVFEHSIDELEEWKQTTLTGANIPFSPSDPRRNNLDKFGNKMDTPRGKWLRKYTLVEKRKEKEGRREDPMTRSFTDSSNSESSMGYSQSSSITQESELESSYENVTQNGEPTPFRRDYNMTCLDVSQNKITSLLPLTKSVPVNAELADCFSHLEKMDLSNNVLEDIPLEFFKYFPNLQYLDIHLNHLTIFPHHVRECTRLISLDVSHNQITELTATSLSGVYSLQELNVSGNNLEQFPEHLDRAMPHLEKLVLSKNMIKLLPQTSLNLPELKRLDLSRNLIREIPHKLLSSCHKLETLEMISNRLAHLPCEDEAVNLPRLNTLKLKDNNLTEKDPFYIPKFILELPSLRIIDLSRNELQGFPPPVLWKSQVLKEIIVSKNNITKLNLDGAKSWSKVEKFHISNNKISELPKDIGFLVSLQSLDVSRNRALSTLPDELGRCSRLWEMPVEGLSLYDDALMKGRVKDRIMYLHHRLKKAQRYFRMKLMVVGYGNRGKTTLLEALKKKNRPRTETRPTVGVVVDDWKYERNSHKYTLSTWDFAGQEEFYSTHQCFLSNRALYLVVYDVSRGLSEIEKLKPWLSNIHFRAPGCPVVVVGTHFDRLNPVEADEIIEEMERKLNDLSDNPGFPEVWWQSVLDATKENHQMERLRRTLKEVVDRYNVRGIPVMGQKVPASYVRLAELLSEESRNLESVGYPVIRHARLLQIVKSEGLDLNEEEELQQAVNFLHEGGVLLHYNETALQLRDFYFINPGWLCRMMAQVVTVRNINPFIDSSGIMKKSDVSLLFRGEIFPPSLIPQYLRLLEKFEIALPRNEEQLLVPCRLPEKKPSLRMPNLYKQEKISRIYSMPYTPLGFWSRLITRLIVFSNSTITETMMQLLCQPVLQYWRQGIFVKWSKYAFFLVDSNSRKGAEELHITVPACPQGYQLMGFLVDHIDALIDEWYPGLTSIDPLLGRELLEKFAPCVACKGSDVFMFEFGELLHQSEMNDFVECPKHKGEVLLAHLAPDVMLQDLEDNLHLDSSQFELKETSEYSLGDGGFGHVYRAIYKNQVVAAKVFTAIGDIHPHKMLRQEATILRRLTHPSVVSMIAVGLRPSRVVVLELASLGSLGSLLKKNKPLSRTIQHKIALQVAEGLMYLHGLMIVYRDLKPDNVLIFSLSPNALVNAKISDYGISQFTTLYGLTAQEGTMAYRAPEVVRRETYSFQADIFSFGITMYCLLTDGHHPYEELEFKSEMDRAVADNQAVPPITQRGHIPWPDMHEIIMQCLQQIPDHRPKSDELVQKLSTAELFSLRHEIPVSVGTTVECMAHQILDEDNVRLWIASGDSEYMQLTWLNLVDYVDESKAHITRKTFDYSGQIMREGRILCMLPLDRDHVLLGTQTGRILLFNAEFCRLAHSSQRLPDSVLSLHLIQGTEECLVLAGLANGQIKFCPISEILQEADTTLLGMNLGKDHEPIRCLQQVDRKIIASCGTKIVLFISSRNGLGIEKDFDTVKSGSRVSTPICAMAVGRLQIYLSRRRSCVVEMWDPNKERLRDKCDISQLFNLNKDASRVTSMLLQDNRSLWIGTGGGHVVILEAGSLTPIIKTSRHTGAVRSLIAIKGHPHFSVVLSGGLGFKQRPDTNTSRDSQNGCIAVWDADFPQRVRIFREDQKKRQELDDNIKEQKLQNSSRGSQRF